MGSIIPLRKGRLRAVFLSDVHLGTRECQADFLLDFLNNTQCDTLYLVGDIIDMWAMSKGRMYWPASHNEVVRSILKKARSGTRVVYVPGNHDAPIREHIGLIFGSVELAEPFVHTTAGGERLLVIHGDAFDSVLSCSRWLSRLGSGSYDFLLRLNRYWSQVRRSLGLPYWSLAGYVKERMPNALKHINNFEEVLAAAAKNGGYDGVVCGHIHHPALKRIDGVLYCNDGDWVENCTALIESQEGDLQLIHHSEQVQALGTLAQAS